jgi:DNA-binding winged helix-turn-helix (wHTH) protein/TolB-like protein
MRARINYCVLYRFGIFEFESDTAELRKNGRAAALEPQPAKALALLLSRSGDVVSREQIREAVWGRDTHVDFDRGLAYCLSQIRSALGDSGDNPRFVQTIPKRGFKFIAPVTSDAPASIAPAAASQPQPPPRRGRTARDLMDARLAVIIMAAIVIGGLALVSSLRSDSRHTVIAVSVFDNETGNAAYDRPVAALSDLVVEHLTKINPDRIDIVGNAAILRQPRNIRNLKAVAENLKADYVLLGQLQQGEAGLRFITHFIRLEGLAHLKANRIPVSDPNLTGLESAVVEEFDRAVREHILNASSK